MLANNLLVWWISQVVAVGILVALFLRWRPGFLGGRTLLQTLNQVLDARATQIQTQLEAAERSREEAARIRQEAEQDIARAHTEARDIVERVAGTKEAIQKDMETRAQEEYERIVGQARVQIDYERQQAELALRRRAADIVVDAAGQIVQRNLDPKSDADLINRSLSEIQDGQ